MTISEEAKAHALALWYYMVLPIIICLVVAHFGYELSAMGSSRYY